VQTESHTALGQPVALAVANVRVDGGACGNVFSLRWTILSRPAGSLAIIPDPTAAVTVIRPDVGGTYRINLRVTHATEGSVDWKVDIHAALVAQPFTGIVLDVMAGADPTEVWLLTQSPDALVTMRPATGGLRSIALPAAPLAMDRVPGRPEVVIGHPTGVTHVDVGEGRILATHPTPESAGSVAVHPSGRVYIWPAGNSWGSLQSVDLASGALRTESVLPEPHQGGRLTVHPSGTRLYGLTSGSPSDLVRFDLDDAGTIIRGIESGYHGEVGLGWPLVFLGQDGARVLSGASVLQLAESVETDMVLKLTLAGPPGVRHVSHAEAVQEIVLVTAAGWSSPFSRVGDIRVYDDNTLEQVATYAVPHHASGGLLTTGFGQFVVFIPASNAYFIIISDQEHSTSSIRRNGWALVERTK